MTHLSPEEDQSVMEKIQSEARTLLEDAKHKAEHIKERPEMQSFMAKMHELSESVHEAANSERAQAAYDQLNNLKDNVDSTFESAKASEAGQWVVHTSSDAASAVSTKVHELVNACDAKTQESVLTSLKEKTVSIKEELMHKAAAVKDFVTVSAVLNKVKEYSAIIAASVDVNVVMKTYSMLQSLTAQVNSVFDSVKQSERGQWLLNLGTETTLHVTEHLKLILEATKQHEGVVENIETLPPSDRALKILEQKLKQANIAMNVTVQKIQESEKMKGVMENPRVQKAVETTNAAIQSDPAKRLFSGINTAKEGIDSSFESVRKSETGMKIEQKGKEAFATLKESADHFLGSFMAAASTAPAPDVATAAAADVSVDVPVVNGDVAAKVAKEEEEVVAEKATKLETPTVAEADFVWEE